MLEQKIISENELLQFGKVDTLCDKSFSLMEHQKENWNLLAQNFSALDEIKQKHFQFDNFEIAVQYNPKRIISSSAKVDEKSIKERKCFLCVENLPHEQKGILHRSKFLILANPYPIFKNHFTIANIEHREQNIFECFEEMLCIAQELNCFNIFYNGPKCGASAPDHLHFQAAPKNILPIENEIEKLKNERSEIIFKNDKIVIYAVENYLRRLLIVESKFKNEIITVFEKFYEIFQSLSKTFDEPLMNIICRYENSNRQVLIFPREKHRPAFFYEEGDKNILISPAVIDLGGVLITPLEKDFEKIDKEIIKEIYRQITIPKEYFEFIKVKLPEVMKGRK